MSLKCDGENLTFRIHCPRSTHHIPRTSPLCRRRRYRDGLFLLWKPRSPQRVYHDAVGTLEFTHFMATAFALNALSGVCSMLRGALMTRVSQRLYAATYRRFFANVCYASMDSWDAEFNQEDLTKCALSDVVAAATMVVNVASRTMATVLFITHDKTLITKTMKVLVMK